MNGAGIPGPDVAGGGREPRRWGRFVPNLLLTLGSLLACAVIGEAAIRYAGSHDVDGTFTLWGRPLRPIHLPVTATQQKLAALSSAGARAVYDPALGWAPKPKGTSANGLYRYNADGIRSAPSEYSRRPRAGVLRIALFGDSFTHGDDVSFEHTWGHRLEDTLKTAGAPAEVINFGVFGYGIDQAFLRWREVGPAFAPDLVVFGLQMENVKRNVNLIRPVYQGDTNLPFSKPRFTLSGDRLELVNSPTLPPAELPEVLKDLQAWRLARYERFFDASSSRSRPWHVSKLLSAAVDAITYTPPSSGKADPLFYDPRSEPARLALRILREFRESVESRGGTWVIVHLPVAAAVRSLLAGKAPGYDELLRAIETEHRVVRPDARLVQEARTSLAGVFHRGGGHYTTLGNEIVAGALAEYLARGRASAALSYGEATRCLPGAFKRGARARKAAK